MVKTADDYLRHASECDALAAKATSDEQRTMIAEMAQTWRLLAHRQLKSLDDRVAAQGPPMERPAAAPTAEVADDLSLAADVEHRVCVVRLDPRERWLHVEWKQHATSAELRYVLDRLLQLLKNSGATKILVDHTHLETVRADDQAWIIQTWQPSAKAAGLKAIAVKKSDSFFARRAANIMFAVMPDGVAAKVFTDLEAARTWLQAA